MFSGKYEYITPSDMLFAQYPGLIGPTGMHPPPPAAVAQRRSAVGGMAPPPPVHSTVDFGGLGYPASLYGHHTMDPYDHTRQPHQTNSPNGNNNCGKCSLEIEHFVLLNFSHIFQLIFPIFPRRVLPDIKNTRLIFILHPKM